MKMKPIDFAKALGISRGTVSKNIGKSIIADHDGMIDSKNAVNMIYINKMIAKGKQFDPDRIYTDTVKKKERNPKEIEKTPISSSNLDLEIDSEAYEMVSQKEFEDLKSQSIAALSLQKLKLEVIKLMNKDRLDKIQIKKLDGELVSQDEAIFLFLKCIEDYHASFKQQVNIVMDTIRSQLDISHEIYVEYKKKLDEIVKQGFNNANSEIRKNIENL